MTDLHPCSACQGLNPSTASACVHCGAARASRKRFMLGIGGASIAAMSLMACYGAPMIDECIQLPDGGFEPAWCGDDFAPLDAGGDASDAGDFLDAGEPDDAGQ